MKPGSILKRKWPGSAMRYIIILRKYPDFKHDFYDIASGKIYHNANSQWLMANYKNYKEVK